MLFIIDAVDAATDDDDTDDDTDDDADDDADDDNDDDCGDDRTLLDASTSSEDSCSIEISIDDCVAIGCWDLSLVLGGSVLDDGTIVVGVVVVVVEIALL